MTAIKKINPPLAFVSTVLFLLHGMLSAFFITGRLPFGPVYKRTGGILFVLLLIHAAIGIAAMVYNIRLRRRAHGKPGFYARENISYYAQRITGVLMIVFTFLHIHAFGYSDAEGYHLTPFLDTSLFLLIALTVCATVHLMFSIKPILISLKVDISLRGGKAAAVCLYVVLVACAVVMSAAGCMYRLNF